MTQTAFLPTNDATASGNHPIWQPLAREAIKRLQDEFAERATVNWDPALEGFEDYDIPELLEAFAEDMSSPAISLLNSSPAAQNLSPEEFDAIAAAGGDPAATAGSGASAPGFRLAARKLISLIRLAASIGGRADRDAMLAPGAISVIEGIPEALISRLKTQLRYVMPSG